MPPTLPLFCSPLKLISLATCLLLLSACGKEKGPDPCNGINYDIQYTSHPAVGGVANGNITVLTPRGDTLTYQLNNGITQASPVFNGVAAGNYLVKVINQRGCSDTVQVTIPAYGAKYAAVKELISGYCGPCHLNAGNSGNKNFDTDASIVSSWDRIKARAVDGNPSFMPQNGQLTTIDKQKITDWVNAGHRQSD
jgi:hypothetical protein